MLKRIVKKYYLHLILIFLCLTPIIWFAGKPNTLINGVDTNFPLNPKIWLERRFFVWNSIPNAGSDFSSSVSGLFFHLVQFIIYMFGFNLQTVELLSFIFWFSLIIISSLILSRLIFPKKAVSQILFVSFYSFNIYLFNSWENVKVSNLSLVTAIPLAVSLIILLKRKNITIKKAILPAAIIGIIVSGTGINPSYFIAFFMVLVIFTLGNLFVVKNKKRAIQSFLFVAIIIFLINSFWIFPTLYFVLKNIPTSNSLDKIGFTNWIDSLSENTSIFNVMRLQGAWDWYPKDSNGQPLYIPYATKYFYSLPFLIFSLVPPILSILSLIFAKKDKEFYLSFLMMLVLGIFLGVGTHGPTGKVFFFFLNHVPFFNLFRSPWYIFTPLVTLSYAGLIGLLFKTLTKSKTALIFGILLFVGNLIYCYPLVTGKIFRPQNPDGFYVSFPSYVFESGNWLSETNHGGRVIGYPDDEIEKFNWKYRGIESIIELVADREVLYSPLNGSNSPIALLINQFYQDLKQGKLNAVKSIGSKLDVKFIFNKKDQISLSEELPKNFTSLDKKEFGNWEFYKISESEKSQKIFAAKKLYYSYPYDNNPQVFSILDAGDQILNPDDNMIKSISDIEDNVGKIVLAKNSQAEDLRNSTQIKNNDLAKVDFEFNIPQDGVYEPRLDRHNLEDFGLNTNSDLKVLINGQEDSLTIEKINDSYISFKPRQFKSGKNTISINLQEDNLIQDENFKNQTSETKKTLLLSNSKNTDMSTEFEVTNFNEFFPYLIEVEYKQTYGKESQVVVRQSTKTSLVKVQKETLPSYPSWRRFSFYFQPVVTKSSIQISLVAPGSSDDLATSVSFDDLKIKKVFTNNLFLVRNEQKPIDMPTVDFQKDSPVEYEGTVRNVKGPHFIVFSENFSPDWNFSITDLNGNKINPEVKHSSINLYANAWYIKDSPESYKFKIFYKPQKLLHIGAIASVLTFLISVILFIRSKNERH